MRRPLLSLGIVALLIVGLAPVATASSPRIAEETAAPSAPPTAVPSISPESSPTIEPSAAPDPSSSPAPSSSPEPVAEAPVAEAPVADQSPTNDIEASFKVTQGDFGRPEQAVKADSTVTQVLKVAGSHGSVAAVAAAKDGGLSVSGAKIRVMVEADDLAAATAAIKNSGAKIETAVANVVRVLATPAQIQTLVNARGVSWVRAPMQHMEQAISGEEVALSGALGLQAAGNQGAGVKIAIIDGGFADLATAQASGDIPDPVTTVDYCGGNISTATQHGTAVAEIVHEMAPAATLYLICISDELDLANAESYAKANGVSIINHSMGWYNTSRGDGNAPSPAPEATVKDAVNNGILWVNAAGNDAQRHWSGTYVYSGWYTNFGDFIEYWHKFGSSPADGGNTFYLPYGQRICAFLKWDAWPTTNQDYDFFLGFDGNGNIVAGSANYQYNPSNLAFKSAPTESFCYTNNYSAGYYSLLIGKYHTTATPRMDVFIWYADLQYQTAAGSIAEPDSSPSAFAVAAQCWNGTTVEPYSSRGPNIANVKRPDITGPDQESGTTYGAFTACNEYNGFAGTSAAAPTVSGAAALVKAAHPTYTVAQLKSYLTTHAIDEGSTGQDNTYGYGLLNLPTPPYPPTNVTGIAYNKAVQVSWLAPKSPSGPITGYTVTADPGGATCTSVAEVTCLVTGLTNGQGYTFTVTATNALGTGGPSDPSATITPWAVPSAPAVSAVGFATELDVSWQVPAENSAGITGYAVNVDPGAHTCNTTTELTCNFTGLPTGVKFEISVVATNAVGPSLPGTILAFTKIGDSYFPLVPNRILDTHAASHIGTVIGGSVATLAANTPVEFQVSGQALGDATRNVPAEAKAVTGILSASGLLSGGWLAMSNSSAALLSPSTTSNLNLPAGDARAAGVTVPLTDTGTVFVMLGGASLTNTADVTFDVTGYFLEGTSGSSYHALTPNRVVDSRSSTTPNPTIHTAIVAGIPATFHVANLFPGSAAANVAKNVPTGSVAVVGILTVTGQSQPGFLSLGPSQDASPTTGTIWFPKGDNRASGVTAMLAPDGTLSVTFTSATVGATTHFLFDVTGYFSPDATGALFVPITPNRIVDSRNPPKLGIVGPIPVYSARTFYAVNRIPSDTTKNIPANAVAVTGTLTVTRQTAGGWLSLTTNPIAHPNTSTMNFPRGDNRATGVTVPLWTLGRLSVTYGGAASGNSCQVIFDVSGYFLP